MERKPQLPPATCLFIVLLTFFLSWPAAGQTFPGGAPLTANDLTRKGPQLPTEPPLAQVTTTGNTTTVTPNQTQLANFAWRQFIALVSPAKTPLPANRGVVDPRRSFVDSGTPGFYFANPGQNLLVWETYAHRSELMPAGALANGKPQGAIPQPWGRSPRYDYHGTTDSNGNVVGSPPDYSNATLTYNNLDETSQIGENFLFFPKNSSTPSNPFTRDYQVLFEAKVNRAERDFVATQRGPTNPPRALDLSTLQLPPTTNDPDEAVEIKAAWRPLGPDEDASRYHTANVLYYSGPDDAPVAENGTFALIGLHIIRKTANYPNLIFTSFEQVDALRKPATPDELNPTGAATGLYYVTNYNTLSYKPGQGAGVRPTAYVYGSQTTGYGKNPPANRVVTESLPASGKLPNPTHGVAAPMAGPFKVVQPPTFTQEVVQVNTTVRDLIRKTDSDSVWQYYQLKGVQYVPSNEIKSTAVKDALALDYYLANIVVESSQPGIQLFKGGIRNRSNGTLENPRDPGVVFPSGAASPNIGPQIIMGGCMGCHGQAKVTGGPAPPTGFAAPNHHVGNTETFLLNPNDTLYHAYYNGSNSSSSSSWSTWSTTSPPANGAPRGVSGFAVKNQKNSNVEVYLIDPDNTVHHNYYGPYNGPSSQWNNWSTTDKALRQVPQAIAGFGAGNKHNNNTEVFLIATDHTVYHNYHDSSTGWKTWTNRDLALSGVPLATSGFAAINGSNNNVEAFLIATDGTVYHNYYDASGWKTWTTNDSAVQGAPKAISGFAVQNAHDNTTEAFLIGTDGTVYHNYYDSSGWSTWKTRADSDSALSGAPKANSGFAVRNDSNNNVEAYLIATDGTLNHNYLDASGWKTWNTTDHALQNAPSGLLSSNHFRSFLLFEQSGLSVDTILSSDEESAAVLKKMANRRKKYSRPHDH